MNLIAVVAGKVEAMHLLRNLKHSINFNLQIDLCKVFLALIKIQSKTSRKDLHYFLTTAYADLRAALIFRWSRSCGREKSVYGLYHPILTRNPTQTVHTTFGTL